MLGFLELSRSEPAGAMEHLMPVMEYLENMGSSEPGIVPAVPDAIECLVTLGKVDEAERLLNDHERKGRRTGRHWAIATAGRCRGLVQAARGDTPGALEALDRAIADHEHVGQPLELARTFLVKGEVARRAKRKALARESFENARRIFDRLGAALWSERVSDELARVGGVAADRQLTPTERRIAELVAEGGSNKEVAAALFVSVKTIEANLSHIYAKLGVRSRTALASRLHAGDLAETDATPPSKP